MSELCRVSIEEQTHDRNSVERTEHEEMVRYVFALTELNEGRGIWLDSCHCDMDLSMLIENAEEEYLCNLIDNHVDVAARYISKTLDPVATALVCRIKQQAASDYSEQ